MDTLLLDFGHAAMPGTQAMPRVASVVACQTIISAWEITQKRIDESHKPSVNSDFNQEPANHE